jgi:hypothetical protein
MRLSHDGRRLRLPPFGLKVHVEDHNDSGKVIIE